MKLFKHFFAFLLIIAVILSLSACADGAPGKDGANGLSAYEIAVKNGFYGSEAEWLLSLAGKDAPSNSPVIGENGNWWINGKDTGVKAEGNEIINNTLKDPTLEGKSVVCLGDDLFAEISDGVSIASYIATLTGANVTSVSIEGATMAKNPDDELDPLSMYKLADAIASKNYKEQKAAANDLNKKSVTAAVNILAEIDFDKVDMLIICFGSNDFDADVPLSSSDKSDVSSYKNALGHALEKICSKYTKLQVFVTTPLYCGFGSSDDSDTKKNCCDATLKDYADATLETARAYKLPAVDNYNGLGINSINLDYYYSSSRARIPNKRGLELAARHIAKALF